MGGGKSSGSQNTTTTVQMTPEQRDLLKAQTGFLTDTAFPAYKETIGGAKDIYGRVAPAAETAARTAMDVSGRAGALQERTGAGALTSGIQGLQSLFDPQYEQQQVNAALQAGRESGRDLVNQQVAGYGGAGGLGSSRAALANANLGSLQEQRQATAAASARAGVQANKAAAANQLATLGGQNLTGAQQSAASRIGYAQTPQDVYSKYASVIFGTPQQSTTPNFAGTQGGTQSGGSSSKGMGFKI
jgi:hypothetical protein